MGSSLPGTADLTPGRATPTVTSSSTGRHSTSPDCSPNLMIPARLPTGRASSATPSATDAAFAALARSKRPFMTDTHVATQQSERVPEKPATQLLPGATRLGAVHIGVTDGERAKAFWT